MKNFNIFIFLILSSLSIITFISCDDSKDDKNESYYWQESYSAQKFFNNYIRKSEITDSLGHMYYMYEIGCRGSQNYSFDLEHRINCKACLNIDEN